LFVTAVYGGWVVLVVFVVKFWWRPLYYSFGLGLECPSVGQAGCPALMYLSTVGPLIPGFFSSFSRAG